MGDISKDTIDANVTVSSLGGTIMSLPNNFHDEKDPLNQMSSIIKTAKNIFEKGQLQNVRIDNNKMIDLMAQLNQQQLSSVDPKFQNVDNQQRRNVSSGNTRQNRDVYFGKF